MGHQAPLYSNRGKLKIEYDSGRILQLRNQILTSSMSEGQRLVVERLRIFERAGALCDADL